MSGQSPEALVRRLFEEVWNQGNLDAANELLHDEYRSVENITFAAQRGPEVLAADMKFYREMYADLRFEIDRMLTHGDLVVAMWRASGIANHEHFDNRLGERTNKTVKAEGVSVTTIADGKIIEHRLYWPRDPLFP